MLDTELVFFVPKSHLRRKGKTPVHVCYAHTERFNDRTKTDCYLGKRECEDAYDRQVLDANQRTQPPWVKLRLLDR